MSEGKTGYLECVAAGEPEFIVSSKGTEGVSVMLKLEDGTRLTWTGWLTDKVSPKDGKTGAERAAEALALLGYDAATGVMTPKTAIVDVQLETYTDDNGVEKTSRKPAWIIDPNRGPKYEAMTPAQATGAKARLKAAALAAAKNAPKLPNAMKTPATKADDEIPF